MLNGLCWAMLAIALLCATPATLARQAAPTPPLGWNSWDSYVGSFRDRARAVTQIPRRVQPR